MTTLPSLRDLPERPVEIAGPERLVGRIAVPDDAPGAVLLCHPHPLHGGSMDNKIMVLAARYLYSLGWGWLRFNFRGVGGSSGTYDEGRGEVDDVRAALAYLRQAAPDKKLVLLGYSFGSYTGARALWDEPDVSAYIAVGPPVSGLFDMTVAEKLTLPKLIICGSNDEFAHVDELIPWVDRLSDAELVLLPGADHYFMGAGRDWLTPIGPFLARLAPTATARP